MNLERPGSLPTIWDAPPSASGVDRSAFIGKKANKTIPVPYEYRRQTTTRERDNLVADIKDKTNCAVIPRLEDQGRGKIKSFDVYGAGSGLEKAVRSLNVWISDANVKSIGSSAWAKIGAYDSDTWYYNKVQLLEDERKQQFKGPIPGEGGAESIPLHSVRVTWPEDLTEHDPPINPRDVFGNKLEGLDGLRMQDEVFINPDLKNQNGRWQLEIVGYDLAGVEVAEDHLNTMIEKVRVDAVGVQNMLNVILDQREGMAVELQRGEAWWPNCADSVIPRLLPSPMMDEPGSFRQDGIDRGQLAIIQESIKLALDSVRHRKGAYDFVVRLGCVALSSKQVKDDKIGEKYPTDKFLKMVNEKFEVDVKKWLANDELGYLILHRLMKAEEFLEPTKSAAYFGYTSASLSDTRPTFRGTWIFKDPNVSIDQPQATFRHAGRPVPLHGPTKENVPSPPATLYVVQIDWTHDEEGQYEKGSPRFYKLEPGKTGPRKNMDINLLELGESRGWHFALESLNLVATKTVSPVLVGFAKRVAMKLKYDINSTDSFATWDSSPTIKRYLQTGRLDSIYTFGIQKTCYKVELTAMWYPAQKMPVWGLAVRHTEWTTHLAELERLSIGRQASWGDTLSTFFPDDGQSSGHAELDGEDLGIVRLNIEDYMEAPRDGILGLATDLLRLSGIVSSVTESGGVRI